MKNSEGHDYSIVAVDKFIQATRDSGYKGTASAVAELVDNSLQAGATVIKLSISVSDDGDQFPITLTVIDNGSGMDQHTLQTALRFGGSTRFNRRDGLGRYGMGLPNSSLSQAQRVTVYTWRSRGGPVLCSYLDLDEIASGELTAVPLPRDVSKPNFINGYDSGTAVTWSRCDRLDNSRISTLVRKLLLSLGRRFRHFLWDGVTITVNGDRAQPIDPLFLHPQALFKGATEHTSFEREIAVTPGDPSVTGIVRVTFSELPVAEWSRLSNHEKRERGIAKGAGVSIVRGGREVDYGWFFLGGKRRENYDDWWRCEIQFDPVLDEAFGITHTKQQIRPRPHLVEALTGDMESTARALNSRARKAHLNVKIAERFSSSEDRATEKDDLLTPLPPKPRPRDQLILESLKKELTRPPHTERGRDEGVEYRIVPKALSDTCFFNYARTEGKLVLVLNPDHPFYKLVYKPLLESEDQRDVALRTSIDLLLLAAARAEALIEGKDALKVAEQLRADWSDTLATFLNG
ncbi:ATP-binding protein [Diaphorobacter sp. DS2]|nr:ATP-binding protein [Diaphorobacter sp. DS2]